MPLKRLIALILLSLSTFISQAGPHDTPSGMTVQTATGSGTVLESVDGGGYTYLKLDQNGKPLWIAVQQTTVAIGQKVEFVEQMRMQNFTSKSLNRSFDELAFAGLVGGQTMAAPVEPATETTAGNDGGGPVEKADGGYTVAEVFANRQALKGQTVKVRGRVVKVSRGILRRNWVHLQDGTGESGKDKIIFRSPNQIARVGSIITAEGRVETDLDFGYGYSYEVLVEDASFAE